MPELPEVETVKNELEPHIVGKKIADITLFWEKMTKDLPPAEFFKKTVGRRVTGLSRRGKYLFFELDSGGYMVAHLKMTGSLLFDPRNFDGKYVRAVILFDNGSRLYFCDPRKFGRLWYVDDKAEIEQKLGPEPLEPGFTAGVLGERLHGRQAPIKAVLLEQPVVAGIGNMYADEALHAAGIHPTRPAASLTEMEIFRLHTAILKILRAAIVNKGASVVNYLRPGGETGTAHFEFRVAHGQQKTCDRCGGDIKRIVVRTRGTYFCPVCQPER
ncbi:DNA-formamidopyrimidine glycosylase [Chloroflexota bacterium]